MFSFGSLSFISLPSFTFSGAGDDDPGERHGERGTTLNVDNGERGGGDGAGEDSSELSSSSLLTETGTDGNLIPIIRIN